MPPRDWTRESERNVARLSWEQVAAFRLWRHHLSKRARSDKLTSVVDDMAGSQAQVLLAAQISVGVRVGAIVLGDVEAALWQRRVLAKAWCMRGTMYLLPSDSLAVFVRGSARQPEREIRWMLSHGASERELEQLLQGVLEALEQPLTQTVLVQVVCKSLKLPMRFKLGGGWGGRSKVACVELGGLAIPSSYLLHLATARGVICSGPRVGNESTFVRADKWIPHWEDVSVRQAETELLVKYLKAFGPATIADFALWTGMRISDAEEIWSRVAAKIAQVDVEGWRAAVLLSDLPELEKADLDSPVVRLLPHFDSFVLGHKSHRNIVDIRNHRVVYRAQGWVSPVLLVNGRAQGVWSHTRKKSLEVHIKPFSKLSSLVSSRLRDEANELGRFLECPDVNVKII